ncbi:MAG: c-type cytochrome [Omnitrophica WOR_2 bacterium]
MKEEDKQAYLEKYHQAKENGVPFFPDIIFKDVVVSLLVFGILVALARFFGAPLDARANPADTTYTPRPEWYFLFLFQLLKYFPGNLEVIGVVLIPTLAILLLIALPFIDRSPRRFFLNRPLVSGITLLGIAGIFFLTIQSVREAPPPTDPQTGDQVAALYANNCAGCHGQKIDVKQGTNLHEIIAQGKHQGMPAWSADLTGDQIDELAGFILSPGGSKLFTENCGQCHKLADLVSGNPLELKNALVQGVQYAKHAGTDSTKWAKPLNQDDQTTLLNFLVAPDGQRLFAINCSPCHGRSISYSGDENQLRTLISKGGMHLEMPPWSEKLSASQLDTLASYVVNPASVPDGKTMFQQFCSKCHAGSIPNASSIEEARQAIATGGAHQTMPVWGNILTSDQLNALVKYTLDTAHGAPLEEGQQLFAHNCSPCHGSFGEGGPNPSNPGQMIIPISSAEYLKTRDDVTLRSIISQGQPNFGMSPFGSSNGGLLDDDQIDAIVTYIRSWEANPPVEQPAEAKAKTVSLNGEEIFNALCTQCHGKDGAGGSAPSLQDPQFQDKYTDQNIADSINLGHPSTSMIAWGKILNNDQITQLTQYIRGLRKAPAAPETNGASKTVSFSADVLPIFTSACSGCHGTLGNWDATSYEKVMGTGDHKPVVIPGDADKSLLAQKILGTQKDGMAMPPSGKLPDDQIQIILDWIKAGAKE